MKLFKLFVLFLLLTSCASTPPAVPVIKTLSSYDRDQVSSFFLEGTGTIKGIALMTKPDGTLVRCGQFNVSLIPVSNYSTERITNLYGSSSGGINRLSYNRFEKVIDEADPLYLADIKRGLCDERGNFSFKKLPAGEYYVGTRILWAESSYAEIYSGADIIQRVILEDGQTLSIAITN